MALKACDRTYMNKMSQLYKLALQGEKEDGDLFSNAPKGIELERETGKG